MGANGELAFPARFERASTPRERGHPWPLDEGNRLCRMISAPMQRHYRGRGGATLHQARNPTIRRLPTSREFHLLSLLPLEERRKKREVGAAITSSSRRGLRSDGGSIAGAPSWHRQ